jgi:hypothetical protein
MSDYRVSIKSSARRSNGAVGQFVHIHGALTEFPDRDAADEWAAQLTATGDRGVWVRDANPGDASADGYLMGRVRFRKD